MSDQLSLEGSDPTRKPTSLGKTSINYATTKSILTRASGFMNEYDYTLNPYSGCSFGCRYCYAAFFSPTEDKRDSWGEWVTVKENALATLRRMRTPLKDKTIYMSSVTDPYQPIERTLGLVRSLLEELLRQQPILVVQTRSALVTRDIDLLKQFERVQVNMTITTDSEEVRKAFEPQCTRNDVRLRAIMEVHDAGVPSAITMTPLLPLDNPASFAAALRASGIERFVVQPFHPERGRFIAGTRAQATRLTQEMGWDERKYAQAVRILHDQLPHLLEGRQGFSPP